MNVVISQYIAKQTGRETAVKLRLKINLDYVHQQNKQECYIFKIADKILQFASLFKLIHVII